MEHSNELVSFVRRLFEIKAIKFGDFKTKIGAMTPVYCDLRQIISYPSVLQQLTKLIVDYNDKNDLKYDIFCGVPYTALPIATAVSLETNLPMVMVRKEAKDYGTKQLVEGSFKPGDRCLIIEDVVTSGSSILETIKKLKDSGLECNTALVVLNRQQGGELILAQQGVKMHALLGLMDLLKILHSEKLIGKEVVDKVEKYLKETQLTIGHIKDASSKKTDRLRLSYKDRIPHAQNKVTKDLLEIMEIKKTNLCVAADVTNGTELLNLAEQVGPFICVLKTHIDIVKDFNSNLVERLNEISKTHNFLIMEDRKFADIGNTVEYQYTSGVFEIIKWATLVTAHSLCGPGVLKAIQGAAEEKSLSRGVFLLAEASPEGCLIDSAYTKSTLELASKFPNVISGIVCQSPQFADSPGLLQLTPGVNLDATKDAKGQQYSTPDVAILEKGADIVVVGRAILKSLKPETIAETYRDVSWKAYLARINSR